MKRTLTEKDLDLINLILDRSPDLAALIFTRLDALVTVLGAAAVAPEQGPAPTGNGGQTPATGQDLENQIVAWFKDHPGKHTPAEIQAVFGATKSVRRATARLVEAKRIKWNGKRGQGSEYEGGTK